MNLSGSDHHGISTVASCLGSIGPRHGVSLCRRDPVHSVVACVVTIGAYSDRGRWLMMALHTDRRPLGIASGDRLSQSIMTLVEVGECWEGHDLVGHRSSWRRDGSTIAPVLPG